MVGSAMLTLCQRESRTGGNQQDRQSAQNRLASARGAAGGGEGESNAQAADQINALIAELKQAKEEFGKMKSDFAEANKQFLAKFAIGASKEEPKKRLSKYEQYEALIKDGKRDEARDLLRKK